MGIIPRVSFYYRRLSELPIITFANVGSTPAENGLSKLVNTIKASCGYGWANGIEAIHYYNGTYTPYPFHVQVFFNKMTDKRVCGAYLPDVKTAHGYEFTLYDPLNHLPILTFSDTLKSWNSRMKNDKIELIRKSLYDYEENVMSRCRNIAHTFKQETMSTEKLTAEQRYELGFEIVSGMHASAYNQDIEIGRMETKAGTELPTPEELATEGLTEIPDYCYKAVEWEKKRLYDQITFIVGVLLDKLEDMRLSLVPAQEVEHKTKQLQAENNKLYDTLVIVKQDLEHSPVLSASALKLITKVFDQLNQQNEK